MPTMSGLNGFHHLGGSRGFPLGEPTLGWRCLLCGEVVDETIVANRKSERELERLVDGCLPKLLSWREAILLTQIVKGGFQSAIALS